MDFIKVFIICDLIWISWNDIKTQTISNCNLTGLLTIVILQIMRVEPKELKEKVAGMLIISIVMFIIVFIWPGSFGGGDIKLMAICGLLLGQEKILRAGWLALITASMYSVLCSHYIKKGPMAEIALGPFISIGVLGVFLDIF